MFTRKNDAALYQTYPVSRRWFLGILACFTMGLWFFLASGLFVPDKADNKTVVVVLRNDDWQETMDPAVLELSEKYQIPQTYAIVPFRKNLRSVDPVVLNLFRAHLQAGLAEIVLHGFTHQFVDLLGKYTEFRGRPLEEQQERIAIGKQHLEQIFQTEIKGFVPPKNSYDRNTLLALRAEGFIYLSSSVFFHARPVPPMKILNVNLALADDPLRYLRSALEHGGGHAICVLYYHSYALSPEEIARLESIFRFIQQEKQVVALTMEQAIMRYPQEIYSMYRADPIRGKAEVMLRLFKMRSWLERLRQLWLSADQSKTLFFSYGILIGFGGIFLVGIGIIVHVFFSVLRRFGREGILDKMLVFAVCACAAAIVLMYSVRGFVGVIYFYVLATFLFGWILACFERSDK